MNLEPIRSLVRLRAGIDLGPSSEKPLRNAVSQRTLALGLRHLGFADEGAYLSRLQADEQEFLALVELLTVNETYFFREPGQIRFFADRLMPRWLETRQDGAPVRILSAGCSTGEEPYTLAIALAERFPSLVPGAFEIVGIDIDREVLDRAQAGVYREFSFRSLDPGLRARYFLPDPAGGWKVCDRVRRMVKFRHQNLLAPDLPPDLGRFSAVFFRNVSIYFDQESRRRALGRIQGLLEPEGCLLTGVSETLSNDFGILPLVEEAGTFYFSARRPAGTAPAPRRTPAAPVPGLPVFAPLPPAPALPAAGPAPGPPPATLDAVLEHLREERFDRARELLGTLAPGAASDLDVALVRAYLALVRKDFAGAQALASSVLASDPWSTDAAVILGLAAKWSEDREGAIAWFKKAVYVRHDCWPAHYYLAELYRAGDETEKARRAYRTVLQALSGPPAPATGLRLLPLDLPVGQLRFLCEHRLGKTG